MYDLYDELEKACDRVVKEFHDLNKKLGNDENTVSKEEIDMLDKITHTIASIKKSMLMIDQADMSNGSSGRDGYYNISGGYSNGGDRRYRRSMSRNRGYSRNGEKENMIQKLNMMYQDARDDQEADVIERIMNELNR